MANEILTQTDGDAPPLDTVLLWLTMTVERDFAERGVFPELRYTSAKANRASSSLHYLTEEQAQAVLTDALHRVQQVRKGLKIAYNGHVNALQTAIAEAVERPSIFAAPAAVCVRQDEIRHVWRGTKQQLQAQGIQRDGPWPGEPGGKDHRCGATDARGYKTGVTRYSTMWPGLFVASIEMPYEVRKHEYNRSAWNGCTKYESAEDYRAKLALRFVRLANIGLPDEDETCDFAFETSVLAAVRQKVQEAEHLLRSARIITIAPTGSTMPSLPTTNAAQRTNTLRLVHSATGTTT